MEKGTEDSAAKDLIQRSQYREMGPQVGASGGLGRDRIRQQSQITRQTPFFGVRNGS